MEEAMSETTTKTAPKNSTWYYFMCFEYKGLHRKSAPAFGCVQIEKAFYANFQKQPYAATALMAIFGVRTLCELANY